MHARMQCVQQKQCSHCDHKGHDISDCCILKQEQEEKASKPTSRSSTLSLGKGASKHSSSKCLFSKTSASTKIADADASDHSDLSSDKTIQVYMAHATPIPPVPTTEQTIERVYKTKAKLRQSNLQHSWLIDSGTSHTMCSHRSWFTSFAPLSNHTKVILSDDSSIPATGTGHVHIQMYAKGKWSKSILQDILYVPDLHRNLLSVSHLACCGTEVRFVSEACHIYDKSKSLILKGNLRNDLYVMCMQVNSPIVAKVAVLNAHPKEATFNHALTTWLTSSTGSLDLWHRCLGHLNLNAITRMADKGLMTSMEISERKLHTQPCKPCLEGKQTREVIHKATSTHADLMLSCIFTNVCGPLPTLSHQGYKYFVTFIDDKSRFASVYPLQEKSEVGKHLKAHITRAELEIGQKVKHLRSDRGGEYTAKHI
jgi:hypothetical protein